jgi:uncharacterized protein
MTRPIAPDAMALLTFVVIAFGWSWAPWIVSSLSGPQTHGLSPALFIIAGFGPSLAGIFTVWMYHGRQGLRQWLARCLTWRLHPGWYLLAVFGPAAGIIAALGIELALGGTLPASPAAGRIGMALVQGALILIIGGPLGEEFGWRGYALPVLTTQVGWRGASLIVGCVWGLWHLPLFFIPGTAQAQMPIALFMASSVAMSVILARMAVNTRFSIIPALVFHWAINAWPGFIPIIPNSASVRPYVLVMCILFVIAAIVFLKPGPKTAAP